MRNGRVAAIGSLFLLLSVAHCSIPDLPSEGGKCPCASGYTCDDETQICRRGDAASSSSSSGVGGSNTTSASAGGIGGVGGAGGAGGTGGDGVGACGGASPWKEDAGVDWADYMCKFTVPKCGVQSDHVLCCDNKSNGVPAYVAPSTDATYSGVLNSTYSWFVCWVSGQEQPNGNTIWYYTSLDSPPGNWGYVAGSAILPPDGSTFDPADPAGTGLPECPCP